MVVINATIWCELYVDSQHRTNNEYFYKLLEVFLSWKEAVWGRAPPHKNKLIGTAASGWTQIEPKKKKRFLLRAFSSHSLLADLLEASASSSLVMLVLAKTLASAH